METPIFGHGARLFLEGKLEPIRFTTCHMFEFEEMIGRPLTIGELTDFYLYGEVEIDPSISDEDTIPDDTELPDEEWESKVRAFLAECAQHHQEP